MSKAKAKRACTYCQKAGHNQRTCEKKKRDEAEGGRPMLPAASASLSMSVPPMPAGALAATEETASPSQEMSRANLHQPIEFEESVKQVHVNGTILRLAVREFESGAADLVLLIQQAGRKSPIQISFDNIVGEKTYEMLGWALQQIASRRNIKTPVVRRNVSNGASEARPA